MRSRYVVLLLVLNSAACAQLAPFPANETTAVAAADTVTMSAVPGAMIARDSLTLLDGNRLSCCSVDSAGVHIQVTGGTLTFFAATSYAEMMFSPDGPRASACVQEVPNGSFLAMNDLLTLTDGENYLLLPCKAGYFTATLTERLGYPDGSSALRQVTLSTGRYGWQRDLLSLTELGATSVATATLSGATVTIATPDHRYSFVALRRP